MDGNNLQTRVGILTNKNYFVWRERMIAFLRAKEMYDCLLGNRPAEPGRQQTQFDKNDAECRSLLLSLVEDSFIPSLSQKTTSSDMWKFLESIFREKGGPEKMGLLRAILNKKMKEGQNLEQHLKQLMSMIIELKECGRNLDDFEVTGIILSSLPEVFETVILKIECQGLTDPHAVITRLLEHARMRDQMGESSQTALKARTKEIVCFTCNRRGHKSSMCYFRDSQRKPQASEQRGDSKGRGNVHPAKPHGGTNKGFQPKGNKYSLLAAEKLVTNKNWICDSGATAHISNDASLFTDLNYSKSTILQANGEEVTSQRKGTVQISCPSPDGEIIELTLKDCLYLPDADMNLFSLSAIARNGYASFIDNDGCHLYDQDGHCFLKGELQNGLYVLKTCKQQCNVAKITSACTDKFCLKKWHFRLGHKNVDAIKRLDRERLAKDFKIANCSCLKDTRCIECVRAKGTVSHKKGNNVPKCSEKPLDLIHSDILGPVRAASNGHRYVLTFIDDHSRFSYVYLLKHKDETLEKFKHFVSMAKNKFQRAPEAIRTDNGSEYVNNAMKNFLQQEGIRHESNVPHTPQQNGVAERKNRSLCDMARTMLLQAGLPVRYWGEAIATANYLQNRLPCKSVAKTPYELWNGTKPSLKHVKPFGSTAYAYVPKEKRGKFDLRAEEGILVGFQEYRGYKILDRETGTIKVCNAVYIDENNVFNSATETKPENEFKEYTDLFLTCNSPAVSTSSEGEVEPPAPNDAEKRGGQRSDRDAMFLELQSAAEEGPDADSHRPEGAAQRNVRTSQRSNKGVPPLRFSYYAKVDAPNEPTPQGEINKLISGEEEDWKQVASKYTTIRTLLTVAASKAMHTEHLKIKKATLHEKLHKVLKRQGFSQGKGEPCLYSRMKNGQFEYVLVYVDDLILCCQNAKDAKDIAQSINKEVEVKQLGNISHYLGIQIERTEDGSYLLNQRHKIVELLDSLNMKDAKPVGTPLELDYLTKQAENDKQPLESNKQYRETVGKLLYLSTVSRPDISTAVGILCRKTNMPTKYDWNAVKRLVRYLKGTMDFKLKLSACDDLKLIIYSDADYAGDVTTARSTSGNLFMYGDSAIHWKSKRQDIVAKSTSEAEYLSAGEACKQLTWILQILEDFGLKESLPVTMYEDNQACIKLSKSNDFRTSLRFLNVKYHTVNEMTEKGTIKLEYCPTGEMIADLLTKPLSKEKTVNFRKKMNLMDFAY